MNIVPAQEIKQRGIAAEDERLAKVNEASLARVKASLQDVSAGRVKHGSAADLINELQLDD